MKVGLVYGGKSVEHEISIITAMQVYEVLAEKYDVCNIYFAKNGKFYIGSFLNDIENYKDLDLVIKNCTEVMFEKSGVNVKIVEKKMFGKSYQIDLGFLALHGASGEDGKIQGFFDTLGLVYTGSNHFGSSIGQDKVVTKDILKANNLSVLDYVSVHDGMSFLELKAKIAVLNYPIIIKPALLGSSVGIVLCENESSLESSLNEAFQYDTKLIVEHRISDFKEVNCSILGNYKKATASVLEEVHGEDEFLSFDSKYMSGSKSKGMVSTGRIIPADISENLTSNTQKLCLDAFNVLNLSGVVRFDLMISDDTVFINEVNTIPGSLSFYLWEHSGISRIELFNKLIELAIEKKRTSESKINSYNTNVLSTGSFKGSKKIN